MAFRYLHAADLHLDTPFEGLAISDPALRDQLVEASLVALDALVQAAVRERVDFVVLAGDVYDGADRGLRAQLRLLKATRELDRAGIWTFIAYGNHDPVGPSAGWAAIRAWPDRVRIFPSDRVETFALPASDGSAVFVSGVSYSRPDVREPLHVHFPRPTSPGFHLAVLHAHVGAPTHHSPYSPCRLEDLVGAGYDAWALGHIHHRQILQAEAPFVAYPGNLQGRNPRERGPKGALIVEVQGRSVAPRFVELAPVRFEDIQVDTSDCEDVSSLLDGLQDSVRTVAAGRLVIARAVATGRSAIFHDLVQHEPSELLKSLRDGAPEGVRWVDLSLRVRPLLVLEALLDRQDLQGELARTWANLGPNDLLGTLRDHDGLAEEQWADEDLAFLRDQAADLALTLLGSEV